MRLRRAFGLLLGAACQVEARSVFAHFMVTNALTWSVGDWQSDIQKAQAAHIDAFALNMAHGDPANVPSMANAFQAASGLGFKLFFSFDYAGNGSWPLQRVIDIVNQYKGNSAYFLRGSQPLVSTFEGPGSAANWTEIKSQTGCFFIPDWSSLGADAAMQLGEADGLFNWAAWPTGQEDMNTYVDASYLQFLGGRPYMMPVSPWFFTNLPGYDKNWLWNSGHLWFDRWQEVLSMPHDDVPEFLEIISWNDYGESHYIGPLNPKSYAAFTIGHAPYNYADSMPHDGWRLFLPYVIDTYKTGKGTITQEGVVAWYRLSRAAACADGGTTGNTASQLQVEITPGALALDQIFFTALLASPANVTVSIGGKSVPASWKNVPSGGVGLYHGSCSMEDSSYVGPVVVTIERSGSTIASINGASISNSCPHSITNWNAWVGQATSTHSITPVSPKLSNEDAVCIAGFGLGDFENLCAFACEYGYCPIGACTCTAMGPAKPKPSATGQAGYPVAGESADYSGLCSFDCNYGHCPSNLCGHTSVPLATPTVSPFTPPAPISGTGVNDAFNDLCAWTCQYGFCPMHSCVTTDTGVLKVPPAQNGFTGKTVLTVDDSGLCNWACSRGFCLQGVCVGSLTDVSAQPSWTQATCDLDVVNNINDDSKYRWQYIDCDTAWSQAINYWNANQAAAAQENNSFSMEIASFFKDTGLQDDMNCQSLTDHNGCDSEVQCKDVNHPAGMFILNSLIHLDEHFQNLYDAISRLETNALGDVPTINDVFAPLPTENQALKIALDVLSLGFALFAAPFWNAYLKGINIVKENSNTLGSIKDMTNALVSNTVTLLKDSSPAGLDIANENDLTTNVKNAVTGWQVGISALVNQLFSGSSDDVARVYDLIGGGSYIKVTNPPNDVDIQNWMAAPLYAMIIPNAWSFNNKAPFVLDSGQNCDPSNPLPDNVDSGTVAATSVCYNNRMYYLLSASGDAETCQSWPGCESCSETCTDNDFSAPSGLSSLTGQAGAYGGLTVATIVQGAVNGYTNNGNKNGWKTADPSDAATLSKLIDLGVAAPGVVTIPVCGNDEAWQNWYQYSSNSHPQSANYPCN